MIGLNLIILKGLLFLCVLAVMLAPSVKVSALSGGILSHGSREVYGCENLIVVHCDPLPNDFNSYSVVGTAEPVYDVIQNAYEATKGESGNAYESKGYIQEYFYVQNRPILNPTMFSVSFWINQDSKTNRDSAIVSHVNKEKTAGWFVDLRTRPVMRVQFSVTNGVGKVYNVSAPINTDIFENIVGTFDGQSVKLYVNGVLLDSTLYSGKYRPDPGVPLTVGINSFNKDRAWKGKVDELRYYGEALSEGEVKNLFNGNTNVNSGLIAFWPFDKNADDATINHNDGKVALQTVSMAFTPDGRLFFTVKNSGEVRIMKDDTVLPSPFVRINNIKVHSHFGLLGIAIDPSFGSNHYVYLYYTTKDNLTDVLFNRVVRFTEFDNHATDEKVLIDNIPAANGGEYAGGALTFGPDDKLYVTVGHAYQIDKPQNRSSYLGKVLRINGDGSIPPDNPYPNSPVYTLGHRNSFGIAFDPYGLGIITENGEAHYDEINVLKKGSNYGFPTTQPPSRSPEFDNSSSVKPIRSYYTTIAPAQAIYYDGDKFPILKGKFLFTSYNTGTIYALSINKTGSLIEEVRIEIGQLGNDNAICIAKSPTGDIYFGGYRIYKLISVDRSKVTPFMRFIKLTENNVKVNYLDFDNRNKKISINLITKGNKSLSSPSLIIDIPKFLLNSISQVSTEDNGSKVIKDFEIKQKYRTFTAGDESIFIELSPNIHSTLLIEGPPTPISAPTSRIQ